MPTDQYFCADAIRHQAQQRWLAIFGASKVGISLTDSLFRFVTNNAAFQSMLGYEHQELERMSPLDICDTDDRDVCRNLLMQLSQGARAHCEIATLYRRKDNTSVPVSTHLSLLPAELTEQRGFLAVTVDMSARYQAEEALRGAQAELGRVARLTSVGAMAASIAHELNQPLAAVVTNGSAGLRWLDRSSPDLGEVRLALQRIINEGHRASQIISSIRAMFRKDPGKKETISIGDLVHDVVSLSLGELKRRQVSLSLELLDAPFRVEGDRVQLQQVFLNLLTNAVDAMNEVVGRPHMLRVRSERLEPDWVAVSVHDSGTGLHPATAGRIFDAFFTTKPSGMGLGLAICQSIVEAHGGWLWASPAHPHGSIFQVVLPAVTQAISP